MKTQCLVIAAVLLGFTNPDTSAAADTGVRITVTIRGAASEADAVVLLTLPPPVVPVEMRESPGSG